VTAKGALVTPLVGALVVVEPSRPLTVRFVGLLLVPSSALRIGLVVLETLGSFDLSLALLLFRGSHYCPALRSSASRRAADFASRWPYPALPCAPTAPTFGASRPPP